MKYITLILSFLIVGCSNIPVHQGHLHYEAQKVISNSTVIWTSASFYQIDRYKFSSFYPYQFGNISFTDQKIYVLVWKEDAEKYIISKVYQNDSITRCHLDTALGVPYMGIEFKDNVFLTFTYRRENLPPINCKSISNK